MHGHGFSLTLISHISFTKQYLIKLTQINCIETIFKLLARHTLYTLLKLFTEGLMRLSLLGELTINQITETAGCVYRLILWEDEIIK